MGITIAILIATIIVSLIGAALVLVNVRTLSQGKQQITRVFKDLIIGFALLEASAIAVSLILLALVTGLYVEHLEVAFDVVAIIGVLIRAFVIYYAWKVYRFLTPGKRNGVQ